MLLRDHYARPDKVVKGTHAVVRCSGARPCKQLYASKARYYVYMDLGAKRGCLCVHTEENVAEKQSRKSSSKRKSVQVMYTDVRGRCDPCE